MNSKKNIKNIASTKAHSKSMVRSLLTDLALYEYLTTTETKAKKIVPEFVKLINYAKVTDDKRLLERKLNSVYFNKNATLKTMDIYKERFGKETGGYVRMFKVGRRKGDNAQMVKLMLKGYTYKDIGTKSSKPSKESTKTTKKVTQEGFEHKADKDQVKKDQVANVTNTSKAKSRSGI